MLTAEVGESVGLSCFPPEGNPRPIISWTKEGRPVDLGVDKYSLDPSGVLLVRDLGPQDGGRYGCSVSNEAGTRTDSPVTLTIKERTIEVQEEEEEEEDIVEDEEEVEEVLEVVEVEEVVLEDDEYLPSPVITDSVLLDRVTGLVHWLPVRGAVRYVVRVSAAGQAVTDIPVEGDVNQVKLHSLDPSLTYAAAVAAERNGRRSEFSPAVELSNTNIKEVTVNLSEGEEGAGESLWVVGMVGVVGLTLLLLLASLLVFRRLASGRQKDEERAEEERMRRYSWIDRRWSEGQTSSFKSDRLLLDNHYDYVIASQKPETYQTSESQHQTGGQKTKSTYQIKGSQPYQILPLPSNSIYHYASSPIIKKEYLMPIKL